MSVGSARKTGEYAFARASGNETVGDAVSVSGKPTQPSPEATARQALPYRDPLLIHEYFHGDIAPALARRIKPAGTGLVAN